ncbi:hypothetical protein M231_06044 [Tremella mesenterica]|uniref:Uncharacterized protein n=1 Tax=Tremella mesenterica TaxID=5217 RepID=A0A4Q1BE59_TREME|nr:hypothetical protein M231_06044 [Tremella mesenterica]
MASPPSETPLATDESRIHLPTSSVFAPIGVSTFQPIASSSTSKPDPSTPIFSFSTPILSSPETSGQGETPFAHPRTPVNQKTAEPYIVHGEDYDTGLGYGDVTIQEKGDVREDGDAEGMSLDFRDGMLASGSRRALRDETAEIAQSLVDAEETHLDELLDTTRRRLNELGGVKEGDGWEQRDELMGMLNRILPFVESRIPLLEAQVVAQRETIATLQQQKRLSDQLHQTESQRHEAERTSWNSEIRALIRARDGEIAAGTRPKKLLEIDVGYQQELEAANKRLEMDNRLMAPRLKDTQEQINKLVNELRHLRTHVMLSTDPFTPRRLDAYDQPFGHGPSSSPMKSFSINTTLGDARAEHLLLAARTVRQARGHNPQIGRLSLDELKRSHVVGPGGGVGYAEGYGRVLGDESSATDSEMEEYSFDDAHRLSSGKTKNKSVHGTPLLPRAKRSGKRPLPPTTPSRNRGQPSQPQTTPGGSTLNDLLRAAEMATRPSTPPPQDRTPQIPMSAMSASRSTAKREDSRSESPDKRRRLGPAASITPGGWSHARRISESQTSHPDASALDLLAQASQLDEIQNPQDPSSSQLSTSRIVGFEEHDPLEFSPRSNQTEGLAPAIDLRKGSTSMIEDDQIDPTLQSLPPPPSFSQTANTTPRTHGRHPSFSNTQLQTPARIHDDDDLTTVGMSAKSEGYGLDSISFQSPTGAAVPGLGRYVHLTSSMPARRVRSPYLKWTKEEDELLARAVAMHGEKWDLVSKGVPTRSYHQVRQRWLRKTGAFDKRPNQSNEGLHGMSGLVREEYEEEPASPTLQQKKKRKNSDR